MKSKTKKTILREAYRRLHRAFGPQGWWPGEGVEEIIVGAVLTQNTNWGNVERALKNLKREGLAALRAIAAAPEARVAEAIRPSGYFNVKARRLQAAARFFCEFCGGDFEQMRGIEMGEFRSRLLEVNGIGPETADDILLYAFDKPSFVIDAYTTRFLRRHNLIGSKAGYGEAQDLFHESLDEDLDVFNEFHALLVRLGKHHCRPKAMCEGCPLNKEDLFYKGKNRSKEK